MPSNIEKLYRNLSSDGYQLGELNDFKKALSDSAKAERLYKNLSSDGYQLGSWDDFAVAIDRPWTAIPATAPGADASGAAGIGGESAGHSGGEVTAFTESQLEAIDKGANPVDVTREPTGPAAYGSPEYLSEKIADDVNPQNPYVGMTRQQAINAIGQKYFNLWYGKERTPETVKEVDGEQVKYGGLGAYDKIRAELAANNIVSPGDIGRVTASIRNSYIDPVARRRVEQLMGDFKTANRENLDDIQGVLNSRETQRAIEGDLAKLGFRNTADMYDDEESKQKAEADYKRQKDAYYEALSRQMEALLIDKYGYLPRNDSRSTARWFGRTLIDGGGSEHEERIRSREAVGMTQGFVRDAIRQEIADYDKKAQAVKDKSLDFDYTGIPKAVVAGELMNAQRRANLARDPDKIIKGLYEKSRVISDSLANGDGGADDEEQMEWLRAHSGSLLKDVLDNEAFMEEAKAKAAEAGISPAAYIMGYVVPGFIEAVDREFNSQMVAKHMPRNKMEYILRGLEDTFAGMLGSRLVLTESQQRFRNQANAQYGEDAGLLANAARTTLGFVGDAPLWGAWGKLGGMVAKRQMAEYMLREASKRGVSVEVMQRAMEESAKHYLGQAVGMRLMQGVPQMAVTMGGAMATSEMARGIRDREEFGEIVKNTLATGVTEGVKGGIIGAVTGATHPLVDRLSGAAKVAGKIGSFAAEAGTFYTAGELEKLARGEDAFAWEDLGAAALNLALIKLTNIDNLKRYADAFAHPKRALEAKKGELTDEDVALIRANADGAAFIDAITSLRPARTVPGSHEREGNLSEEEINAGAEAYRRMMTNPDIPFGTKQKLARIVEGLLPPPGKAVTVEVEDAGAGEAEEPGGRTAGHGGYVFRTRDIDGQTIELRRYDSREEAEAAAADMNGELFANTTEALEGVINKVDSYTRFRDSLERKYQEIVQRMGRDREGLSSERLTEQEKRIVYLHQHYDDLLDIYKQIADGKEFDVNGSELAQQFLQTYNEYLTSGEAAAKFRQDYLYEQGLLEYDKEGRPIDLIEKAMKRRSKEDRALIEGYQQAMREHLDEANGANEANEANGTNEAYDVTGQQQLTGRTAPSDGEGRGNGGTPPPDSSSGGAGGAGSAGAGGSGSAGGLGAGGNGAGAAGTGGVTARSARRQAAYNRGITAIADNSALPGVNYDLKLALARMEKLFPANDPVLARLRSDIVKAVENGNDAEADRLVNSNSATLNDSQREAIEQYRDMMEASRGLDDAIGQQVQTYERERRAALEPFAAPDGSITELLMRDGSKAYHLAGNLDNTLGGVMVVTESGERKQVPVSAVKSVGERRMLDDVIRAEVGAYGGQLEQQYEALANGGAFVSGSQVELMIAGRPFKTTVAGVDAAGNTVFTLEDGSEIPMSSNDARRAVADADKARIDAQLKQEAEAAVRQQQTARFGKGIVGFAEGAPDFSAEGSVPKVVAEYLESTIPDGKTAGHSELLKSVENEAERLNEQALQAAETIRRLENKAGVDSLSEEETAALDGARAALADAGKRRRKWGEIRQALMTEEERRKFEAARQKEIRKAQAAVRPAANAAGTAAVPTGKELLEQFAEQGDAEKHVESLRANLKAQYRDELVPQLSAVRDAVDDYRRGLTDTSEAELHDMVAELARLEAEENAMKMQSDALSKLASSLGRLYAARNNAAMTPHERKIAAMERESDPSKKIKLAREAYADDEAALAHLGIDALEPQDEYEWVAENLGKGMLNWEGMQRGEHYVRGVRDEFGRDKKRGIGRKYDTNGINYFLAPEGKGMGIQEAVHHIAEGSPYDTTVIHNALLEMLQSASKPSDITNRIVDDRIARAEEAYQENLERALEAENEAIREMTGMEPEEYDAWIAYVEELAPLREEYEKSEEYWRNHEEYLRNQEEYANFATKTKGNDTGTETGTGELQGEGAGEVGDSGGGKEAGTLGLPGKAGEQAGTPENAEGGAGAAAAEGAEERVAYTEEERESLRYHDGESIDEYVKRNDGIAKKDTLERLYLQGKYGDRLREIEGLFSDGLTRANAFELGERVGGMVSDNHEGYALLSLLKNIPPDAVLPFYDGVSSYPARLTRAKNEVNTSPTEAQKEAGNYKKGHVSFGGYDYTIENPKGSKRSGVDKSGKPWSITMQDTYGYILGKYGKDGDHIDMFINDDADLDFWDGRVFVVDQGRPAANPSGEPTGTLEFDEHKVMYGYRSWKAAKEAYERNYEPGWWDSHVLQMTGVSKADFDKWLADSDHKRKPFAEYVRTKNADPISDNVDQLIADVRERVRHLPTWEPDEITGMEDERLTQLLKKRQKDLSVSRVLLKGSGVEGSGSAKEKLLKNNIAKFSADVEALTAEIERRRASVGDADFMVSDMAGEPTAGAEGTSATSAEKNGGKVFRIGKKVVTLQSQEAGEAVDGQRATMPKTAPWRDGVEDVTVHTTLNKVRGKYGELFEKAKAGDAEAAEELVSAVVKPEKVKALVEAHPNARVAYVHAEEATGRNKLPAAYAAIFKMLGHQLSGIVQTNKPSHTGSDRVGRFIRRARFDGEVEPGAEYIIIDDHVTMGSTLRDLKDYIESKGGKVVAVSTLTASMYATKLRPTEEQIKQLKDKGITNEQLRELGIADSIDGLTRREAAEILVLADKGGDTGSSRGRKAGRGENLRTSGETLGKESGALEENGLTDSASEASVVSLPRFNQYGLNESDPVGRTLTGIKTSNGDNTIAGYYDAGAQTYTFMGRDAHTVLGSMPRKGIVSKVNGADVLVIPEQDIDMVLPVLVRKGYKVGIADSVDEAPAAKPQGAVKVLRSPVKSIVQGELFTDKDFEAGAGRNGADGNAEANGADGRGLSAMSDEELLKAIGENEQQQRGIHIDEYDRRHRKEYDDVTAAYSQMLEDSDTSLDDAYSMYADVKRQWADKNGYASRERTQLLGQIDALEDYIGRKEEERIEREDAEEEARLEEERKRYEEQKNAVRANGYDLTQLRLRPLAEGETSHVERRYKETGMFSFTGSEYIESIDDVAFIFRELEDAAVENTFMVFEKDGVPTIIHLAMGTYDTAHAPVELSLAAYKAINPDKVYFVHNHPSGNLKCSQQDRGLMKKFHAIFRDKLEAGIIIDTKSGKYGVFYEFGDYPERRMPTAPTGEPSGTVPMKVYSFSKQVFDEGWNPEEAFSAKSSFKVAEFVSSHRLGEHEKMSLIVMDAAGHVTGNVFLPWTTMQEACSPEGADLIAGYVNQMGGSRAVLYGNYAYDGTPLEKDAVKRLNNMLSLRNVFLQDAVHIDRSTHDMGELERKPMVAGEAHDAVDQMLDEVERRQDRAARVEADAIVKEYLKSNPGDTVEADARKRATKAVLAAMDMAGVPYEVVGKKEEAKMMALFAAMNQEAVKAFCRRPDIRALAPHGIGRYAVYNIDDPFGVPMYAEKKNVAKWIKDGVQKYGGQWAILDIGEGDVSDARPVELKTAAEVDGELVQFMVEPGANEPGTAAPVFVSNALKAVEGMKQDKASPEQWLAMLTKAGGLKAGEDKWLGLTEWLKEQGGDAAKPRRTLTKQEVLDFIRKNQIEVEEVNYAESMPKEAQEKLDNFNSEFEELIWEGEEATGSVYTSDWVEWAYEQMIERYGDDFRNAFYTVGNGTNAKLEPAVDYDDMPTGEAQYYLGIEGTSNTINSTRLEYTTNGLQNKKEIALVVPTIEPWNQSDVIHFGDAGGGRAVAWVRFGEATIDAPAVGIDKSKYTAKRSRQGGFDVFRPNGSEWGRIGAGTPEQAIDEAYKDDLLRNTTTQRVLVIDEIQSKRHQEGREKGYKPDIQKFIEEKSQLDALPDMSSEQFKRYRELAKLIRESDVNYARQEYDDFSERMKKEWGQGIMGNYENWPEVPESVREEIRQAKAKRQAAEEAANKIPDAPFEKNWHELAMKRMLRYAAEHGYDKVAWTKGAQQAKRYDLSKVVGKIEYAKNEDGTYDVFARDHNGNDIHIDTHVSEQDIASVYGKELAQKIVKGEKTGEREARNLFNPKQGRTLNVIEGEDLTIGGEGMKGFYDEMLPRFMNKYGKKWGVKVGEVQLPGLEGSQDGVTMWSVDVTPEMRESVMQGQPMFQKEGKRILGWSDSKGVHLTEAGLNPNTPIHETTHLWDKWCMKEQPELWKKLVTAMKKTALWEEIRQNPDYRNIWEDEDRLASEVHSRLSGANSEEEFMKAAFKKDTPKKIIDEVKNVLRKFWEAVLRLFGKQTKTIGDDWNSLDAIVRMPLRDLLEQDFKKVMRANLSGETAGHPGEPEFHIVTDKDEIARLESEPTEKGYRNVVLNEDGSLGSPMGSKLGKKGVGRKATSMFEYGKWERSDEHPELATENGKIDLIKPDGKPVEAVDYNPYIHIRPDKVNRQFKQAWERPNLIYIETEYPASELNGGYQADKAAKAVGKHKWGTQGEYLILSRWDKPVRMVPWEEVADDWEKAFKTRGVEFDIVPPKLLPILVERGVEILPPHKNMGKACNAAYEAFLAGRTGEHAGNDKMYRHVTPEVEKANAAFNQRLAELDKDRTQKNRVLKLGNPGTFLLAGGVQKGEIIMDFDRFVKKSSENYKHDHPFTADDIKDLPKAINAPIAVFDSTSNNDKVILTELTKNGRNFVVVIRATEQHRKGGVVLEVNEIQTLFPKDAKGIVKWFADGLFTNVDKEKALRWIEALQTHPGTTISSGELDSAAKVIKEFETPKLSEEKLQELFPEYSSIAEDMGDTLGGQQVTLEAEGPETGTLGWYDPNDGSVHVVLPAHGSAEEVRRTVCHEKLGHEGLVALFTPGGGTAGHGAGQDEVNKFGSFIFRSASKKLRQRILEKADEEGYAWDDPLRLSKAAQEVFADIAADGPRTADEFSLWDKVKHYIIRMANKVGLKVRGLLNDHDLSYYVLKTGEALKRWNKMSKPERENLSAQAAQYEIMRSRRGKPRKKRDESMSEYLQRLREWEKWKMAEEAAEAAGDPMPDKESIDKRYEEQYNADMAAWRERNGLPPAADAAGTAEGPGEFPKRREGETPQEYAVRVAEYETNADMWRGAPNYFDYLQRAQEEYRIRYEEWKRRYDLQEAENTDLELYEGRGGDGPQTYTDLEAEMRAERDMGEAFGIQMDSEGAKRHAKLAVIDRRKNLESSNAEDAIWIHDFVKRTDALAAWMTEANGVTKPRRSLTGKTEPGVVTGKMLREALPFIIEGTYWEERLQDADGHVVGYVDISDQLPIKRSPELDALLADIKEWYDHFFFALEDAGLRGDAGYIGEGYVNHIWDREKSDPSAWEQYVENYQRTKSPNMKHREVDTYQQGIDVGLVPKFKDIADMLAYYSRSNNEALANKKFLDALSFMCVEEENSDGEVVSVLPLLSSVKPSAFTADRYVQYHVPGVGDVWVIKDIQKPFANIFGTMRTQDVNKWLENAGKVWDLAGSTAKKIELALSGFHALALWEVDVAQNGPVAGLADLFKYIVTDSAVKGTLPAYAHPDDFKFAASHLVQLGATEDYAAADVNNITGKLREMVMELYKSDSGFRKAAGAVGSVPAIILDWVNKGFDKVLWNYLHDGLKIASMMRFKRQIDRRAEKEGLSDDEREKLYDEAGQYVNDMFGGQYWELLNVSPGTLKWMRRLLLSPDWLVSTNRHFFANFGFGSLYSDGGWREYLKYNWNNIKRAMGSKLERDELRRFRSKNAKLCYLVGVLFFWNVLYNALNAWNRKRDEEKMKEEAEAMRKINPDYKSPYELAYPNGMQWYDYTMLGNALGQQTHLFTGRYEDGTETYVRWGKQFREFPELFLGKHGLEVPAPFIERMKAKANPNIGGFMDFLGAVGVRGFEEGYQNREMREKYGQTISTLSALFRHFIPFGMPTQADKEYKVMDFFMPSSKGFSRYKAVEYFKTFIIDGDMRGVEQTYRAAVMNGVDAEECLQAAIATLKAERRRELVDGVTDLSGASERFDAASTYSDRAFWKHKMEQYLGGENHHAMEREAFMENVERMLEPTADAGGTAAGAGAGRNWSVATESYLKHATHDDIIEDYRVRVVAKAVSDMKRELDALKNSDADDAVVTAFRNRPAVKRLFQADKLLGKYKRSKKKGHRGYDYLRSKMGGSSDAELMESIRALRHELLQKIDSLTLE